MPARSGVLGSIRGLAPVAMISPSKGSPAAAVKLKLTRTGVEGGRLQAQPEVYIQLRVAPRLAQAGALRLPFAGQDLFGERRAVVRQVGLPRPPW